MFCNLEELFPAKLESLRAFTGQQLVNQAKLLLLRLAYSFAHGVLGYTK